MQTYGFDLSPFSPFSCLLPCPFLLFFWFSFCFCFLLFVPSLLVCLLGFLTLLFFFFFPFFFSFLVSFRFFLFFSFFKGCSCVFVLCFIWGS